MIRALGSLKEKMKKIAAQMLAAKPEEIDFVGDAFCVAGNESQYVSFRETVERAYQGYPLPDGVEPGLEATSNYDPPALTYSYSANVAFVELDPGTGHVSISKFYVVHDCGKQINPAIVEGQMIGSLAQGIGGTMLEEFRYNESGELVSSTFMDYLMPTSLDIPIDIVIDHMETPSPFNYGYKGMSEGGCIGAPAAISNALDDAMKQIGGGVVLSTPLSDEYVWKLLNSPRKTSKHMISPRLKSK
jgi:carbon-monoxide dehydrogenase large subunit